MSSHHNTHQYQPTIGRKSRKNSGSRRGSVENSQRNPVYSLEQALQMRDSLLDSISDNKLRDICLKESEDPNTEKIPSPNKQLEVPSEPKVQRFYLNRTKDKIIIRTNISSKTVVVDCNGKKDANKTETSKPKISLQSPEISGNGTSPDWLLPGNITTTSSTGGDGQIAKSDDFFGDSRENSDSAPRNFDMEKFKKEMRLKEALYPPKVQSPLLNAPPGLFDQTATATRAPKLSSQPSIPNDTYRQDNPFIPQKGPFAAHAPAQSTFGPNSAFYQHPSHNSVPAVQDQGMEFPDVRNLVLMDTLIDNAPEKPRKSLLGGKFFKLDGEDGENGLIGSQKPIFGNENSQIPLVKSPIIHSEPKPHLPTSVLRRMSSSSDQKSRK